MPGRWIRQKPRAKAILFMNLLAHATVDQVRTVMDCLVAASSRSALQLLHVTIAKLDLFLRGQEPLKQERDICFKRQDIQLVAWKAVIVRLFSTQSI
jgi:hypothetical protein